MAAEEESIDERLQEFVETAKESAPGPPARDPVTRPMIHHWCDAIGDTNPIYIDEELAAQLKAFVYRGTDDPQRDLCAMLARVDRAAPGCAVVTE